MLLFDRIKRHLSPPSQRRWFTGLVYKQLDTLMLLSQLGVAAWLLIRINQYGASLAPAIALGLLLVMLGCRFFFMSRALRLLTATSYELGTQIRRSLLHHLTRLSVATIYGLNTGKVSQTLAEDVQWLENQAAYTTAQIVSQILMLAILYLGLFWLDIAVGTSALLVLLVGGLLFSIIQQRLNQMLRRRAEKMADAAAAMAEYAQGIAFLRAAGASTTAQQRFDHDVTQLHAGFRRSIFTNTPLLSVFYIIIDTSVAVGVLVCAIRFDAVAAMSVTHMLLTLLLLFSTITPLRGAIALLNMNTLTVVGEEHIAALEAIKEQPAGPLVAPMDNHDIDVRNITFTYPGNIEPSIRNVSFSAPKGTMTAIVGASGSGKSTLAYLLLSFYPLDKGEILLGGNNIHCYQTLALYDTVTMVFQETALFRDTVANNLRLGDPNASQEMLERATRAANIHDTIIALPQGYDTPLGVGGSTLSGGERQRLAIARAMLKQAPIIFLDEATASLDLENERLIQHAVDSLTQHKTVFVIAHRLSTIIRANQILVMDRGELLDCGTHRELLQRCARYQSLWHLHQHTERWCLRPGEG